FFPFVLGTILADLWQNKKLVEMLKTFSYHGGWSLLILAGLIFSSGILPEDLPVWFRFANLSLRDSMTITHTLGAACILLTVLTTPGIQNALRIKPTIYLGRISYSLYLLHLPLIASVGSFIFVQLI